MRHRFILLAAVLSLLAAACGGDSQEPTASSEPPPQTTAAPSTTSGAAQTTTTEAPTPTATPLDEPAASAAQGTGVATVGDTTWEFALTGDPREMCNPDLSGLFFVSMFGEDQSGQEVALSIQVPRAGGDAVVQAGGTTLTGELWIADLAVYTASGGIALPDGIGASADVAGNTVSGTATFYEDRALSAAKGSGGVYEAGILGGTFAVTCPAS